LIAGLAKDALPGAEYRPRPPSRNAARGIRAEHPDAGVVYVLRDAKNGQVLKAGMDWAESLPGSWERYRRAQNRLPQRQLELEVTIVNPKGASVQSIESSIHQAFIARGHIMPWENLMPPGLGRPGPGVPFVYQSNLAKQGWRWVVDTPGADPVYRKV